ncbi:aldose epimerase family protein [Catenovulum adriaticum]|uniref:Aldose 1-epimerase n=1 Tax=Catenovulum adriaticum TaxID=2984846 RepID=A0ABY7AKM6_9ALTE|nr:aldose epimerase family protein [Catenovulum sp. TS8]WAJ68995.1 galactose mutarotase [Catenovulum sp. TS8]
MSVNSKLSIETSEYGITPAGKNVQLFTLTNAKGAQASITNFGAILVNLMTPDSQGQFADIVLGFDHFEEYLTNPAYFGATIGRFGNRIANGQCKIDGKLYTFAQNNGTNQLHGGLEGFDKKVWQASTFETPSAVGVHFDLLSEDGDQGYPGNLTVRTTYQLDNNNKLSIEYTATTDQTTVINLTNHSYFNLNLANHTQVLNHELKSPAKFITELNQNSIPTGEYLPVEGTAFDFLQFKKIGQDIDSQNAQIEIGSGYDHNFVLDNDAEQLTLAAEIIERESGRRLKIQTTEPGFQFYTGNFLDENLKGKGRAFGSRSGFCIEPQHVPDSPNQAKFKSTLLKPDETYNSKMVFEFDAL